MEACFQDQAIKRATLDDLSAVLVIASDNRADRPPNLLAEGFPVAVCKQGEGGGDLYNRSGGVKWGAESDALLRGSGNWAR